MRRSRTYIATALCFVAAIAFAPVGATTETPAATARIQQALDHLRLKQYDDADRQAMSLATDPAEPAPRAWLIAATARQRRADYASALRAYRLFLGSCSSVKTREYVVEQMASCRDALGAADRRVAPSKRLTPEDVADLARVEKATQVESSEHFVVRARNAALAKLLTVEAEAALKRICHCVLAGQEYPHSVDLYVWTDRADYLRHATDSPEWSGGAFSFTTRDGVVTRRIDLTQRDEGGRFATVMLDRVLPHEMSHLVLRDHFGDAACPLFLDEGLAMLSEAEVDNQRLILAGTALAGKRDRPLERLLVVERRDLGEPAVFYAESFSLTNYVHSRTTRRQFRAFLDNVKHGCTVRDALQRALYLPHDEEFLSHLAAAWQDHAVAQAQMLRALDGGDLEISLSN